MKYKLRSGCANFSRFNFGLSIFTKPSPWHTGCILKMQRSHSVNVDILNFSG